MLEKINDALLCMPHEIYSLPFWEVFILKFIAKDLIGIVPVIMVILWLWGPNKQIIACRHLVTRVAIAISVSMIMSWILKCLFPQNRPFVYFPNCNFLHHVADYSFPSDHGSIFFAFAFSFLFWHRIWSGILLTLIAFFVAWSRIYFNIHWPLDMVGGLLSGLVGCLSTQVLWRVVGLGLYQKLERAYRICFFFLIRNGWIHR